TSQCGGSVLLSAGSHSSYLWNNSSTSSTLSASSSGTYSVAVTNAQGCSSSDTIDVSIFTVPSPNLGPDTTQCGGSIALSAGSFSSYLWNNNSTSSSITVSSSGTYSVAVTNAQGCSSSDTIDVSIFTVPSPNLGPDTSQCGGSVLLSAGSHSSYLWNNSSTSSTLSASSSGTYSVEVTDANGCKAKDTIVVTINALPSINLGSDTSQCGGSVLLSAGSHSSYLWNNSSTSSTLFASSSGTYSVAVTNAQGCSSSDTIDVSIFTVPSPNLGPDTTQCGGSIALSAGSFSSYLWNNNSTSSSITVSSSGKYSVEVTDANGCKVTDTIKVDVHIPNDDFLVSDTSMCVGEQVDALEGSNYLWSTGEITRTLVVKVSGIFSVKKLDENGCEVLDTLDITAINFPIASFTFDKTNQTTTNFDVDFTNTSVDHNSLSWDFGDGSFSTSDNPNHSYTVGSYTVKLIAVNECGSDTVEKVVAHTAGVETFNSGNIKVYPNPASNNLSIVSEGLESIDAVVLFDVYGQTILSYIEVSSSVKNVTLDVSALASGTYYVDIVTSKSKVVKRVVITK
ncbi:T9SS type A sorting domain-containing protein, partial [Bacteroidia bacterium]|nr:T9SS type A sorting domain-containing protein [Bacteroidia bacterium]